MYIGDYAGRRALYTPDALAVIDAGAQPELRLTYGELNDRANRLAHWLQEQGIAEGDRVGIVAHDGVAHLDLFFACGKLGAISVPYNWRLHWQEQVQVIRATAPRILMYSEALREALGAVRKVLTGIERFIPLEGQGAREDLPYARLLELASNRAIANPELTEDHTACLLFTGGTTGLPKGAEITHKQIAWNALNTIISDLHHGDITLNVFPLFHTGGLFVYTLPLLILGGTVILTRRFDADQVLDLMARERVTVFAGVPTMYELLTQSRRWSEVDLSSIRFCTSGGAPLPVALVTQYHRDKGLSFKQGFGMTEWGPGCFALAPEEAISHAGSIGRPNFFVGARVVDDHNHPLGAGEVGELVLKGPSGFKGYFQNEVATEAAFDAQGWFHTGDLARFDEGQRFFIVDRKKDMFISGGENVYPAEIEAVLHRHPAVAMCAVVGVPDPRWGEVGVACVQLKPGEEASPEALRQHLKDNLARYKVPREVRLMEALPISGAGKILKRALKDMLLARHIGA